MCVAVIGGMERLGRHYVDEAGKLGIGLRVFNRSETNIGAKIRGVDAMVIFTNKVSHRVKTEAMKEAKARGIPVFMHHACGVCTLRDRLNCLFIINKGGGCKDV